MVLVLVVFFTVVFGDSSGLISSTHRAATGAAACRHAGCVPSLAVAGLLIRLLRAVQTTRSRSSCRSCRGCRRGMPRSMQSAFRSSSSATSLRPVSRTRCSRSSTWSTVGAASRFIQQMWTSLQTYGPDHLGFFQMECPPSRWPYSPRNYGKSDCPPNTTGVGSVVNQASTSASPPRTSTAASTPSWLVRHVSSHRRS